MDFGTIRGALDTGAGACSPTVTPKNHATGLPRSRPFRSGTRAPAGGVGTWGSPGLRTLPRGPRSARRLRAPLPCRPSGTAPCKLLARPGGGRRRCRWPPLSAQGAIATSGRDLKGARPLSGAGQAAGRGTRGRARCGPDLPARQECRAIRSAGRARAKCRGPLSVARARHRLAPACGAAWPSPGTERATMRCRRGEWPAALQAARRSLLSQNASLVSSPYPRRHSPRRRG